VNAATTVVGQASVVGSKVMVTWPFPLRALSADDMLVALEAMKDDPPPPPVAFAPPPP